VTVSNEDREAAIKIVTLAMLRNRAPSFRATAAVNALVSLGWGPPPRVSRKTFVKYQGNIKVKTEMYLESCGIEVTDDD
jgi:hypothetical protein